MEPNRDLNIMQLNENIIAFDHDGSNKEALLLPAVDNAIAENFGGLVLDVSGELAKYLSAQDNVITIRPGGLNIWNPVHSPKSTPLELADSLMTVFILLSTNTETLKDQGAYSGKFLQKDEYNSVRDLLLHSIGLHRTISNYITISDIHDLIKNIMDTNEYIESIYPKSTSHYGYFAKEWLSMPNKQAIAASAMSLTSLFVAPDLINTFCSKEEDITFSFADAIDNNSLVVLDAPELKYGLSSTRAIGILLKFYFQLVAKEKNKLNQRLIINDYQYFATQSAVYTHNNGSFGISQSEYGDKRFIQEEECKCTNIFVATSPMVLADMIGYAGAEQLISSISSIITFGSDDPKYAEGMVEYYGKTEYKSWFRTKARFNINPESILKLKPLEFITGKYDRYYKEPWYGSGGNNILVPLFYALMFITPFLILSVVAYLVM